MDPDATLVEISDNLGTFWNPSTPPDTRLAIAEHIILHVQALHEWILKGGALPSDWDPYHLDHHYAIAIKENDRYITGSDGVTYGPFSPNRPQCPCTCECNSGGFCGGCGHAGCGRR